MWPFKRKEWEKLGVSESTEDLRADIKEKFKPDILLLRDKGCRHITDEEFEKIIWMARPNPWEEVKYASEIFDCDDFADGFIVDVKRKWARLSKGKEPLGFGYISSIAPNGIRHAYVWKKSPNGMYTMYEPQTNKKQLWYPGKADIMWQ